MYKIMIFCVPVPEGDEFEIRKGNNSQGDVLVTQKNPLIAMTRVTEGDAFYIRLKARCSDERHLEGVFATFEDAVAEGSSKPTFICHLYIQCSYSFAFKVVK